MGYSVELKTSSRQQAASKAVKEKAASPRANRNPKFQNKNQVKNAFVQPQIERYDEFKHNAEGMSVVQLKLSRNHKKQLSESDAKKDDELVKHMSNLPGYLQQIERGENFQEKALNFGVLDWKRLENWKYNEKLLIPARSNTKASASCSNSSYKAVGSSTNSSTAQSKPSTRKQPSLPGSRVNSAHEERQGIRSQGKVTKPQGFETAPWSTGRKYSDIQIDRGKRKESDRMTTSEKETSSSNLRSPISSHDMIGAGDRETNTIVEEELDFARKSSGHKEIVLLLPKSSSKKSSESNNRHLKSRKSFDGNLAEAIGKRFSGCFSPEELFSMELNSEIPHSCPLPLSVATKTESDLEQFSLANSQGVNIHVSPSKDKSLEVNRSNMEPSTPRRSDQHIAEHPAIKGRPSSPSRRFSFSSIGRMTRSFSFKEGSAVPQLSTSYATVKSGPVGSEPSAALDKLGRDNAGSGSRSRSSPLRRLLDPLLKPRGVQPAETVKPSIVMPMNTSELLPNKNCEASSIQALLQLTLKNGLPLFKLVVDNSNDILAAAVKKLPTPEDDVSSLIYALYSVHEIKKKSGNWMSQGSKGKSPSLGYNIVGQMKVSNSSLPDLTGPNTESILYGVEIGQGDKEAPKFMPGRELAAIVIHNPSETNNDEQQCENNNLCSKDGFTKYFLDNKSDGRENEDSNNTTVILPGGIHGLPNKGEPSPLINRWRSSGSCDCGGWDVGCKLQILTNQSQNSKNLEPSVSCSTVECLNLFVEGGHQEKKPIFSLAPFKSGVYSVEFNPSISLLQAFFIAVAFLSSHKLSNLFEVKFDSKSFLEPRSGTTMKIPTAIQGEIPAKYVTNPPPSPVGRV